MYYAAEAQAMNWSTWKGLKGKGDHQLRAREADCIQSFGVKNI